MMAQRAGQPRHAVCVIVDGLRAAALGAYGGCGVATPWLDRLASQSIVADSMWTAGCSLSNFYTAVGAGQHGIRLAASPVHATRHDLFSMLADDGLTLHGVTDDPAIASRWQDSGQIAVDLLDIHQANSATTVDDTRFAQLLAVAAQSILDEAHGEESRLHWIHSRGWHGSWDAPLTMRQMLLDEDDPPAPEWTDPPQEVETSDPDQLLAFRSAYAAQVAVLDECIGGLMAAVEASPAAEQTLVVLVGARGLALGEHGLVGCQVRNLYGELLHVPLMIRQPGKVEPQLRHSRAVGPCDITATLLDWFGTRWTDAPFDGHSLLDRANDSRLWHACQCDGEAVMQTPGWMLRLGAMEKDSPCELYAKPDDRWEANEVSSLCGDVPDQMLALLETLQRQSRLGQTLSLEPLAAELVTPER